MSRQTELRIRAVLLSGLVLFTAFQPALAAPPVMQVEVVRLKDGSAYQGELVEKVMGDHVTVKLATGQIKRFEWKALKTEIEKDVDTTPSVAPAAPTPAVPSAEPADAPEIAAPGIPTENSAPPFPPGPAELPTVPRQRGPVAAAPEQDRYVFWPEPDRRSRPLDGQRLYVGLGIGWDFPATFPGELTVGYEPLQWLSVELDARYGNPFGPSIGEMVRFGLPLYDVARIGIGTGVQESFLVRSKTDTYYAYQGAPNTGYFWNLEIFGDTFFTRNLMLRTIAGFSYLLNNKQYAGMCSSASAQCFGLGGEGGDPWAAAQGTTVYGYVKVDLIWHFQL